MRVLLIKLSSMGDVIHTLPALSDALRAIPQLKITWLVDQDFAEIPAWHPAVEQVIPVALRKRNWRQVLAALQKLRKQKFDLVLDAQGLIKSALFAQFSGSNNVAGYAYKSCREGIASIFYRHKYTVAKNLHAIDRTRTLFAQALHYTYQKSDLQYNLQVPRLQQSVPYLFCLHGTTWESKHWPDEYWQRLIDLAAAQGYKVKVTWATADQKDRAQRFADYSPAVIMLQHLTIGEAALELNNAAGVIAVDTGFAHLAAALDKPVVAVFGSTDIHRSGVNGNNTKNLQSQFACAPCMQRVCNFTGASNVKPACMQELTPELVWKHLNQLITFASSLQRKYEICTQ